MAKCIMIVDDSVTVLQVLKLTLSNAGYEIIEACDGEAALEMLAGREIDMMITDLNMPKLDIDRVFSGEELALVQDVAEVAAAEEDISVS